jgi:hypothetical protein
MRLQWPPCIDQEFQLIPLHHLLMLMTLLCRSDRWTKNQSLIGSISWLSSTTRPDIAAAHSFLSSYMNKLASGPMKALHYIHSTHEYGISFTSNDTTPMHS